MFDLYASLIGIIASALAGHPGLLAAVTLIGLAWLGRAAARRLEGRLGVPLGPLLAFLAVAAACLSLYLANPAPPRSQADARVAREARRRQEWRRSNAQAEQMLNRMMWQGW
jgi:hypothetical protein